MAEPTVEEILAKIKDMDNKVGSKVFSTKGTTMNIVLSKRGEEISIDLSEQKPGKSKVLSKGLKESTLRQKLDEFMAEKEADECISVACLVGSIKTKFGYNLRYFLIPILGYDIREGGVNFEEFTQEVTEEQLNIAKETGMAFYDELSKELYPIRKSALFSIGRYMDAAASYKVVAKVPLGNALLLAERMADDPKKIKLAYQNYDVLFKPVISIGVEKTNMGEFHDMFEEYFSCMAEKGIYSVSSWSITEERVSVTVNMITDDYSVTFFSSNCPGESNKIKISKKIAEKDVVFAERSAYNTAKFSVKELVDKTYAQFQDAESCFEKLVADTATRDFSLKPEEVEMFKTCLGQRRYTKITSSYKGRLSDAIKNLIIQTYEEELPPKQEKQRDIACMAVIRRLAS